MSTDIKFSKARISKVIQSGGSFGSWSGNLGKKALKNIAINLARDNLPRLVKNLNSNAIYEFERKISGKRAVRAEKGFTLYHKIIRRFVFINRWICCNSKIWNKKPEGGFLEA